MADTKDKITLSTIKLCMQAAALFQDPAVYMRALQSEAFSCAGLESSFDGYSKVAAICRVCNGARHGDPLQNRVSAVASSASLSGRFVCDALYVLQTLEVSEDEPYGLLKKRPSKEFLEGSKNKKESFVQVLLVRKVLLEHIVQLAGEGAGLQKLFLASDALRPPADDAWWPAPGSSAASTQGDVGQMPPWWL